MQNTDYQTLQMKLKTVEGENSKWSNDYENQKLANFSKQKNMEQQQMDAHAVTDVQFQQMKKMVDKLSQENEGINHNFTFSFNVTDS